MGLLVPSTSDPRLALVAYVQFVTNDLLFTALATVLLALLHIAGIQSVWGDGGCGLIDREYGNLCGG